MLSRKTDALASNTNRSRVYIISMKSKAWPNDVVKCWVRSTESGSEFFFFNSNSLLVQLVTCHFCKLVEVRVKVIINMRIRDNGHSVLGKCSERENGTCIVPLYYVPRVWIIHIHAVFANPKT